MNLVIHPDLQRKRKGCGNITIIGKHGEILREFPVGTEANKRFCEMLDQIKRERAAAEAFKALQDRQAKAMITPAGIGNNPGMR
jgi:hypothetical protein